MMLVSIQMVILMLAETLKYDLRLDCPKLVEIGMLVRAIRWRCEIVAPIILCFVICRLNFDLMLWAALIPLLYHYFWVTYVIYEGM